MPARKNHPDTRHTLLRPEDLTPEMHAQLAALRENMGHLIPAMCVTAIMQAHHSSQEQAAAEFTRRGSRLLYVPPDGCLLCGRDIRAMAVYEPERSEHAAERIGRLFAYGLCGHHFRRSMVPSHQQTQAADIEALLSEYYAVKGENPQVISG